MWFDAQFHFVLVCNLRGIFPVRDNPLLPLPFVGIRKHGPRRVDDPIRCLILWPASRSPGQHANVAHPEMASDLTGRDEIPMGRTGDCGVRVQGVTVTGERTDLLSPVLDVSLESF